jgi:hypothetical protein
MNPLGDNLLPLMVLAFGGAMAIGTLMALVRPPETRGGARSQGSTTPQERAPLVRSIVFIAVGAIAAVWALASLISG